MATLQENYYTASGLETIVEGNTWYSQGFTPAISHSCVSISLFMSKSVTPPSAVTVSLRATTGEVPSGEDLVAASITVADIPVVGSEAWVTTAIAATELTAGQKYAIVLRVADNAVYWGYTGPDPAGTYTGGQMALSVNAGVDWTDGFIYTTFDLHFREYSAATFPVDAVARVSSIRHIWQLSKFVMQVGLGDLGFDIDVAEATVRSALDTAKEVEEPPAEPLVEKPAPTEPTDEVMAAPEPIQLTEYAKRILEKPAAKALAARVAGLRQGVEAIVTPYAIDVLMQREEEATKLQQLQRMQKAATATGITGYARDILEKRALSFQRELEALYRRPR